MPVVCDTGPLLHLSEADALYLLRHLQDIRIPPAVDDELSGYIDEWQQTRPDWIAVVALSASHSAEAAEWH